LSESTLEAVQAGRSEYAGTLAELGFISREDASELGVGRRGGGGRYGFDGSADSAWLSRAVNKNWGNARFLKAAICAGFYPSVLKVQPPKPKFKQVMFVACMCTQSRLTEAVPDLNSNIC
jgi:ATP-dependent RNA helicase DHX57